MNIINFKLNDASFLSLCATFQNEKSSMDLISDKVLKINMGM